MDATHWWASQQGVTYRTADAGATWQEVATTGFPAYWNFETGHFIDANHAWWPMVSAEHSTESALAMTSDGGAHWKFVNPPQPG